MDTPATATAPPTTKTRLLDVAAEVFLEFGFANASLELVRQRAGVSNGSLYHHYPTKTHLADALYAHVLRDYHAQMMGTLAKSPRAEVGVKGLIRATVQWVVQNPHRARLLHDLRMSGALVDGPRERDETNAKAFGVLAVWVAARTAAGEMREMPQPVWTALVFSPVMALMPHWANQPKPEVSPVVRAALEHAAWMAVAA
jgi:AcrR family transcriptional regulator